MPIPQLADVAGKKDIERPLGSGNRNNKTRGALVLIDRQDEGACLSRDASTLVEPSGCRPWPVSCESKRTLFDSTQPESTNSGSSTISSPG